MISWVQRCLGTHTVRLPLSPRARCYPDRTRSLGAIRGACEDASRHQVRRASPRIELVRHTAGRTRTRRVMLGDNDTVSDMKRGGSVLVLDRAGRDRPALEQAFDAVGLKLIRAVTYRLGNH